VADPVDEAADELYGLPFDDFVAERNARAKALRKAGDKEAADEVAKLPKPSQVAWIANQLARAGADDLLEAGQAIREAQLGGGGREALRDATAAERAAVEDLLKAAKHLRDLSRDASDRLRALLHAVAGDEELRELFEAGRLVAEPEPGGAWPEGAFVAAPRERRPAKQKAAGKPKESVAERRKREAAERKAAERAKREAERQREEAERRKLERRLRAARDAADEAKRRLEAAQEAYEDATHEVARIEEQLS
jgi:hypothetical protein